MNRRIHPIERESYEILRSRVDTGGLPPFGRAVVERVVHASGDPAWVADLVCDEAALAAGADALRAGAPVVCDVEMVAAGVTARPALCLVRDRRAAELAGGGLTRSAAGIRMAYREVGDGAVWVVGCAPTALAELLALGVSPALVIGLPVGFVGAAQAKAALRASGLPALSNRSERGGAGVAAAALNALLYAGTEPDTRRSTDPAGSRYSEPSAAATGVGAGGDAADSACDIAADRGTGGGTAEAGRDDVEEWADPVRAEEPENGDTTGSAPRVVRPPLLIIGHGTRSAAGMAEFERLVDRVRRRLPGVEVGGGLLELAGPPVSAAVSALASGTTSSGTTRAGTTPAGTAPAASTHTGTPAYGTASSATIPAMTGLAADTAPGATPGGTAAAETARAAKTTTSATGAETVTGAERLPVTVVPLVLASAGHAKGDIPAALARERRRHPGLRFRYGRPLGPHPALLTLLQQRVEAALAAPATGSGSPGTTAPGTTAPGTTGPGTTAAGTAVLLVGRGATDPDANAEIAKVARLFWEGRPYDPVEFCFVSLARPGVPDALERLRLLGATRIVVAPYFLFPGVLPDRIAAQAAGFAHAHRDLDLRVAGVLGDSDALADLVGERYREAVAGDIRMNCDTCQYRVALPGFAHRVGAPQVPHHHPHDPVHHHAH